MYLSYHKKNRRSGLPVDMIIPFPLPYYRQRLGTLCVTGLLAVQRRSPPNTQWDGEPSLAPVGLVLGHMFI